MKNVNLKDALLHREHHTPESRLLDEVKAWLSTDITRDEEILQAMRQTPKRGEGLPAQFADRSLCFSVESIRTIAIKYRLRFLPSNRFRGEIPPEALSKIRRLENKSGKRLEEFYILAPAKKFKLGDCNEDPLLFVPVSDGKYLFIHQWGGDISWYRQWMSFPLKSWRTLILSVLTLITVFTLLMPNSFFANGTEVSYLSSGRIIFFLWLNLVTAATLSFAGFAFNFTFSAQNWNSKYFNG